MNVNKKFDRFRQWGREKMGAEVSTKSTEEFKSLEKEMDLRYEGMLNLSSSTAAYLEHTAERSRAGFRGEKHTPLSQLAQSMVKHGGEFEDGNPFGERLILFGKTQSSIAEFQDEYVALAQESWGNGMERNISMLKEYQTARKNLANRRLAFDTTQGKMAKARKEDLKTEDELRSQKAKFDEASEDVFRRMQDIVDVEGESISELEAFLDAQLQFFENAADSLRRLKRSILSDSPTSNAYHGASRHNALARVPTTGTITEDEDDGANGFHNNNLPPRPATSGGQRTGAPEISLATKPKPMLSRTISADPGLTHHIDSHVPALPSVPAIHRTPPRPSTARAMTDSQMAPSAMLAQLRPANRLDSTDEGSSPVTRTSSPAHSLMTASTAMSRSTSWSSVGAAAQSSATPSPNISKKGPPPPPPPSRAPHSSANLKAKPPPPPPPMKRGEFH